MLKVIAASFLVGVISFSTAAFARDLPDAPQSDPALVGVIPILDTASSNLKPVAPEVVSQYQRTFELSDGTKISSLYFEHSRISPSDTGPVPLILANFGLFTDEYSPPISYFVNALVLTGKLKADVLVVDNVTSAKFFALNHEMGLGGFDEGKILLELARDLHKESGTRPTYLFGVSLGGNAVVQALLEDQREGTHRFNGAITFSAVLDEEQSSQTLLTSFGHSLQSPKLPSLKPQGQIIADGLLKVMIATMHQLLPESPVLPAPQAGDFYYGNFQQRLKRISKELDSSTWNPSVSTDTVESYILSSSALVSGLDHLNVPLIAVHAENDPLVPFSQFKAVEIGQRSNPNVYTLATRFGGHWGFFDTYGADWIDQLVLRLEGLN